MLPVSPFAEKSVHQVIDFRCVTPTHTETLGKIVILFPQNEPLLFLHSKSTPYSYEKLTCLQRIRNKRWRTFGSLHIQIVLLLFYLPAVQRSCATKGMDKKQLNCRQDFKTLPNFPTGSSLVTRKKIWSVVAATSSWIDRIVGRRRTVCPTVRYVNRD